MISWKIFIGWILVIVSVAGCLAVHHPAPKEPGYQNKPLSKWLRDFDNYNLTPEQMAMAAEAVRHIGARALPFLVERLSETNLKQSKLEADQWRMKNHNAVFDVPRPPNPRHEALAGLDALGSEAAAALSALEKLLHENPPDPQALYIAARTGSASLPLLTRSLASKEKLIRMEAQLCLDMLNSRSELLYPKIPVGPDAPSLDRRLCEFNLKMLQAAVKEYNASHPEMELPNDVNQTPPPSLPPP